MNFLEQSNETVEGRSVWLVRDDLATPNTRGFESDFDELAIQAKEDVVLDLDGVERLDSGGVGLLLMLLKRTKSRRARLIFRHPTPVVLNVLKMTAMDRLAEVEL
jgi:anti-anti-sigma factor